MSRYLEKLSPEKEGCAVFLKPPNGIFSLLSPNVIFFVAPRLVFEKEGAGVVIREGLREDRLEDVDTGGCSSFTLSSRPAAAAAASKIFFSSESILTVNVQRQAAPSGTSPQRRALADVNGEAAEVCRHPEGVADADETSDEMSMPAAPITPAGTAGEVMASLGST